MVLGNLPQSFSRLMAVGLGIVSSIGITMLIGLYFTTMHGIMPFLCLGGLIELSRVSLKCEQREDEALTIICITNPEIILDSF